MPPPQACLRHAPRRMHAGHVPLACWTRAPCLTSARVCAQCCGMGQSACMLKRCLASIHELACCPGGCAGGPADWRKELGPVLGVCAHTLGPPAAAAAAGNSGGGIPSAMPLALIVDDRDDVSTLRCACTCMGATTGRLTPSLAPGACVSLSARTQLQDLCLGASAFRSF